MKILHLANHCHFGNGNVHAAVDLACAQAKEGHEIVYGSSGGDFVELLSENHVRHVCVPQHSRSPQVLLQGLLKLRRLIAEFKPDIVHAHMMTGAVIAYPFTRFNRPKLVTTVHNSFDKHAIVMGLGDRVIAVSEAVATIMRDRGVSAKKIRTVLNGTLGAARRGRQSAKPSDLPRPAITTVCGLHPRKGIDDLIAGFDIISKQHATANLFIIGEGPCEDLYKKQAAALEHSDRVHFLGQLRDPNPYLLSTDIFVLASHSEPFGLVLTEAREAGCAIAASNVDGIPEVLAIGDAGIMFPPHEPVAIASALLSLLNNEKALQDSRISSLNRLEFFDIARVCRDTLDVYIGLI
ncbi:glycosyltransferase involved in cell wall biosynthesis [Neorhizobium sp. JUb45]|nr:glycosyltransferase involved in cell wall biosynthesis [Neorhizobium sp. JUb45]